MEDRDEDARAIESTKRRRAKKLQGVKTISTTVRLPLPFWMTIQNLKGAGLTRGVTDAVLRGLVLFFEEQIEVLEGSDVKTELEEMGMGRVVVAPLRED